MKKEEETATSVSETSEDELPNQHFTETDLQKEWNLFLDKIKKRDAVLYNAISSFRLSKHDEDTISVNYPSGTAKSEFEKIQSEFFNHFKHKVNHFKIKVNYNMDVALKKEIMTKRKLFEKMAAKNPLLKDLDDLFKFDFS